MSRLQIHVCNPCGLQAPSFQSVSSLISAKWRLLFSSLTLLGRLKQPYREGKEVIEFNESLPFLVFTVLPLTFHINAATLTITNAFMCLSEQLVGKEDRLLITEWHLFRSCGVLNSECSKKQDALCFLVFPNKVII